MEPEPDAPGEEVTAAQCLALLATSRDTPDFLLLASMDHLPEMAPALLALLERAADGDALSDDEATLMFRGLHMLGTARDTRAFQPLLRLLRREAADVEHLLGDAPAESLPGILAGVFDGDAEALFAAVVDKRVEEITRYEMLMTAAFLCWEKRIERQQMAAFLERFDDERLTSGDDVVSDAWQSAIALLGLRTLVPRVERAWRQNRVAEMFTDKEDFRETLARAEANDETRFADERLGYFVDIVDALSWVASAEDSDAVADFEEDALGDETVVDMDEGEGDTTWTRPSEHPVTNPMRHVGRNDPCPCGSGKKAKRCCLAR
jgi:hypothetical protein